VKLVFAVTFGLATVKYAASHRAGGVQSGITNSAVFFEAQKNRLRDRRQDGN
jgi:hypothetical protein